MVQVREVPWWPGVGSTSIVALPLPADAEPEAGIRAAATRLPSGLTATEVTALPVKAGPKSTAWPFVVTMASPGVCDPYGAFGLTAYVTTQPPDGSVAMLGRKPATGARPGTGTGCPPEPALVITNWPWAFRPRISRPLPGGGSTARAAGVVLAGDGEVGRGPGLGWIGPR